jgi:hypothetical protein
MAKNNKKATAAKSQVIEAQTAPISPAPRWSYFVVFLIPLITYLFSAGHSVTFEDSGVFIGAASSWGLPQPPGYPLYTLIAHIFTLLPFGTVAYRVHILSGLCAAGAVLFFYLSVTQLFRGAWQVALLAALTFAFADTLWSQAIVAEVYPLHILIFSTLFYLTLQVNANPSRRNLLLFGIVFGLGLANHWPLLIMGSPVFLAFAWSRRREILNLSWQWLSVALIIPTVLYFLMMYRSQQDPAVSFLGPINTFSDLWAYISRSYYRALEAKWESRFVDKLLFFGDGVYGALWREWYLAGGFVAIGLVTLRRFFSPLQLLGMAFSFLATTFFLTFTITFEYNDLNQNVMKVFHLVPIYMAAISVAAGIFYLHEKFGKKAYYAAGAVTIIALVLNFLKNDLRTDKFAENYARFVLDAIPVREKSQALIAGTDADVGPLAYVFVGMGERKDLRLFTQSGVFFKDRIFDPFQMKSKVRYEKTEQFIKNEGLVYSTKSVDVFENQKDLPFSLQFNGLFYEISANTTATLSFGPEWTDRASKLLDEYSANPRTANWSYHREIIASRLCNFIVIRGIEHPAFKKSRACQQVWGRHLSKLKRYAEADQVFSNLLDTSNWMINAERHLIRYHRLINSMEQINNTPGSLAEKQAKVLAAVEVAKPAIEEYPHCGNSVFVVFESLQNQVTLPADVISSFQIFKKCKKDEKKTEPKS